MRVYLDQYILWPEVSEEYVFIMETYQYLIQLFGKLLQNQELIQLSINLQLYLCFKNSEKVRHIMVDPQCFYPLAHAVVKIK